MPGCFLNEIGHTVVIVNSNSYQSQCNFRKIRRLGSSSKMKLQWTKSGIPGCFLDEIGHTVVIVIVIVLLVIVTSRSATLGKHAALGPLRK